MKNDLGHTPQVSHNSMAFYLAGNRIRLMSVLNAPGC